MVSGFLGVKNTIRMFPKRKLLGSPNCPHRVPPHHFVPRLVVNKDHLSAIGAPDVTGQHGQKIRMIPWDSPKKNGDRRCPSSSKDDELPRLIIDAWKNPYLQYKMVPQFVS